MSDAQYQDESGMLRPVKGATNININTRPKSFQPHSAPQMVKRGNRVWSPADLGRYLERKGRDRDRLVETVGAYINKHVISASNPHLAACKFIEKAIDDDATISTLSEIILRCDENWCVDMEQIFHVVNRVENDPYTRDKWMWMKASGLVHLEVDDEDPSQGDAVVDLFRIVHYAEMAGLELGHGSSDPGKVDRNDIH